MFNLIQYQIKNYLFVTSGVVAVVFALMLPMLIASVGVTVDMSQAYLVKTRLNRALDAAALAAAATGSEDQTVLEDKVDAFMNANYPETRIGDVLSVDVNLNGNLLTVGADARFNTSFMKIFGFDLIDVSSQTTVVREVRGLEIVLVLDNTGSMSTNNNIQALRDASTNFVQILFEEIEDEETIRIGLVPYSSSVNVGSYGWGLDENDNDYGDPFVEPPLNDVYSDYYNGMNPYTGNRYGIDEADLEYDTSEYGEWHGCVEAEDYPLDTEDHAGPWTMYRFDWNGRNSYEDYNNYNGYDGSRGDYYNSYYGPNYHCPDQQVLPLDNDELALYDAIDNMQANGFTLGNYGMVWGWRLISPEEPFTEGAAYDDEQWDKVVVMMTDGQNTMNSYYTAYGKTNEHNVDPDDLNDRFIEVCDAMKAENILVYTVTFYSNVDEDTKEFYRQCATQTSNYHDAPSQEDLVDVFEQISRELSNLHIRY